MSRFYIGIFALMTLAAVAFAGVVIPQLSEQSTARNHKDKNENNDNNNNKLTICHIPPDNPDNPQTIEIKRSALRDHLDHGDLECACDPDGDGVLCDEDQCDNDPNKIEPGQCGCGNPDTDTDADGTADCNDTCPNDPNKIEPGQCGCGNPDTDMDGDGTADCNDPCPNDPDNDADGDGVCGDVDGCPNDSNKTEQGQCGCGNPDTDTDADGTADCNDTCPNDPDNDADGDGVCGDVDGCPNDGDKTEQGQCGCGNPDTDTDSDNTADCNDGCDNDPNKTEPGHCGCGVSDDGVVDADADGCFSCVDCNDNNPNIGPGHCINRNIFEQACDGIDSFCSRGLEGGGCEPACDPCADRQCNELVSDGCGGTITCGSTIDNDNDNCNCLVDCDDNNPNIRPSNCNGDGISKFDKECDGIDSDCSEGVGGCEPLCAGFECSAAGLECGTLPDGCGGTLECGPCDFGGCILGQCCIATRGCLDDPSGNFGGTDCGLIRDQCGQFYSCGPCPEGFICNEETNKCEDPCGGCPEGFLCDRNTENCVTDPDACVPQCNFANQLKGYCGRSDGCGGVCTNCPPNPSGTTCVLDDLAAAFSQSFRDQSATAYCAPLCSSSSTHCGPCLDCDGDLCTISENFCDPGFLCELSEDEIFGTPISTCVEDPDFACQHSCNYLERCNPDTGQCECCAVDLILGTEICSVCITGAFQVCATTIGGGVCCNQLNVANVCF